MAASATAAAAALVKYKGHLDGEEIELVRTEEKLSVHIAHASRLYSWRGEFGDVQRRVVQKWFRSAS